MRRVRSRVFARPPVPGQDRKGRGPYGATDPSQRRAWSPRGTRGLSGASPKDGTTSPYEPGGEWRRGTQPVGHLVRDIETGARRARRVNCLRSGAVLADPLLVKS